jgi:hypothetical protein
MRVARRAGIRPAQSKVTSRMPSAETRSAATGDEDLPRVVAVGEAGERECVRRDRGEDIRAVPDVLEFWIGKRPEDIRMGRVLVVHTHDRAGRMAGRRLQEQRIHQAERRRVRADADGEDRHRHAGERAVAHQQPEPDTKILHDRTAKRRQPAGRRSRRSRVAPSVGLVSAGRHSPAAEDGRS